MKPIITTMTALAVVLTSLPSAQAAMAMNKPINMNAAKPQAFKIKPPRIHIRRQLAKPMRVERKNDRPSKTEAGPQPEPPTAPIANTMAAKPSMSVPPLPRTRPYNEFEEADNSANVGPETDLPKEESLFDDQLVALLPEIWGVEEHNILEGIGNGALDEAFETPPGSADPFAPGPDDTPDLAGYDPGGQIQPGGPNDPDAGDQLPSFFGDRLPSGVGGGRGNGQDQSPRNPSNAIEDPRGQASNGRLPTERETAYWPGNQRVGGTVQNGEYGTLSTATYKTNDGSYIQYAAYNPDNVHAPSRRTAIRLFEQDGKIIKEHYVWDEVAGEYVKTKTEEIEPADNGGDDQPVPIDGAGGGIDVALCGNLIPMFVCMRGADGGPTPFDMLSQPSETGSIRGGGAGEDLGLRQEMVTNTGDGSFNTERGRSGGGGSGGVGDWRDPGDPDDPRF